MKKIVLSIKSLCSSFTHHLRSTYCFLCFHKRNLISLKWLMLLRNLMQSPNNLYFLQIFFHTSYLAHLLVFYFHVQNNKIKGMFYEQIMIFNIGKWAIILEISSLYFKLLPQLVEGIYTLFLCEQWKEIKYSKKPFV